VSTDKALTIIPRSIDEVRTLATMLSKSSLLPPDLRGKEADVAVSILAGQELGMPPMAAIRGVHVVKGKPVLSADAMVGVVLGRGIAKYFRCVEESPEVATYETHRNGDPEPQRMTWTMEDAKRAQLTGGDNWKKYPRAMLKARCKAALARDVYPDVLAGCYTEDEAREFDDQRPRAELPRRPPPQSHHDAEDAEVVEESNGHSEVLALIDMAGSEADLSALAPKLAALAEPLKSAARAAYKARRDYLRNPPVEEAAQ
jgi:hypothetical protein